MKYIETPSLSRLSQALTHEGSECSVHTRIEAYSCKNIKRDKKLFRSLEIAYQDEVSSSPPLPSWMPESGSETTPFGPMDKHASRKTLYLLIATLNVAFRMSAFVLAPRSRLTLSIVSRPRILRCAASSLQQGREWRKCAECAQHHAYSTSPSGDRRSTDLFILSSVFFRTLSSLCSNFVFAYGHASA